MPWNRPMFLSLVLLLFAVTVNSKYRGPPDAVKMITVYSIRGFGFNYAIIEFEAFEVDTKSYKVELISSHEGKSTAKTFAKSPAHFDLEPNGPYVVRVFAVNEYGQSPPSPDIILPHYDFGFIFASPEDAIVEYMLGNRVNVTWIWRDWMDMLPSGIQDPIEFIIRYGDNKNASLWNTRTTNNTWIILDDLKKDTQYSAYVISKNENSTSSDVFLFPIFLGEDMTGLPEPVITIESVFKKELFTPGDSMTIKCSVPPNTNLHKINIELTVGDRVESISDQLPKSVTSITMYTTANEDVDTAKCRVSVRDKNQVSRSSYRSWKVKKPLNDEYLRRRYEEIEADKEFMSFRKA